MLNDRELLRLHVAALFVHNPAGRLTRANEPGGKAAPRFCLGRTADGSETWFRRDLDDDTLRRLKVVCTKVPDGLDRHASDEAMARCRAVLERLAPIEATWSGPAFRFPAHLPGNASSVLVTPETADVLRPHLGSWCEDAEQGKTICAVVINREAVSICASVRTTAIAHEAGVETATAFRGNGYAPLAVAGWAAAVRAQNRIPLYSTSWANTASLAVARKLNLAHFASDIHIT